MTSGGAVLCILEGFKPLCSTDGCHCHSMYDLQELTVSSE